MLPYSPLHHLLADDVGEPLVMTSGNVSDEPIAYEDDDACARLADIADLFLLHDRPIETRTDDSVVRVVEERPVFLRRSRGFVPGSLPLPVDCGRHLLACGAELKNTFALAKDGRAWVGHHIGDLKNFETLTLVRHRDRPLPAPVRDRARGGRARPAPGVPVDEARDGARRRAADRGAASPRASRGVPGRARRRGSGRGRDLRRQRIRRRRHRLGRRAARGRPRGLRARRPPVPGAAPGRRRRGAAAVADGVRVAHGRAGGAARAPPRAARARAAHLVAPGGRPDRRPAPPRPSPRVPAASSTRWPPCAASEPR